MPKPKSSPSSTWFKLWAPRYILDSGIKIAALIDNQTKIKKGPFPLYSSKIPNPNIAANQLWPLGLPY